MRKVTDELQTLQEILESQKRDFEDFKTMRTSRALGLSDDAGEASHPQDVDARENVHVVYQMPSEMSEVPQAPQGDEPLSMEDLETTIKRLRLSILECLDGGEQHGKHPPRKKSVSFAIENAPAKSASSDRDQMQALLRQCEDLRQKIGKSRAEITEKQEVLQMKLSVLAEHEAVESDAAEFFRKKSHPCCHHDCGCSVFRGCCQLVANFIHPELAKQRAKHNKRKSVIDFKRRGSQDSEWWSGAD